MTLFTSYAEKKFDILNKHKIYITREQIEDAVKLPDKIKKRGKYIFVQKDEIKVVCQKTNEQNKIITFYPIKN